MSYAFQDPSVPLTAVAAAQADALAPAFALYATHQRVANLESGASTQGLSLATAEAALEDITAGHVAFNTIAIAVNPTATDTITIGADVY